MVDIQILWEEIVRVKDQFSLSEFLGSALGSPPPPLEDLQWQVHYYYDDVWCGFWSLFYLYATINIEINNTILQFTLNT